MVTFETKRHIEFSDSYHGVNFTEFSFQAGINASSEHIIEEFIHSTAFTVDSLPDIVKKKGEKNGFLLSAFDFKITKICDFKFETNEGTLTFLYDFLNGPDWGADRDGFANLLNKYIEIHEQLGNVEFYIISKDWFDVSDTRLREPENWVYTYYFLIISVDKQRNILSLSEWSYD